MFIVGAARLKLQSRVRQNARDDHEDDSGYPDRGVENSCLLRRDRTLHLERGLMALQPTPAAKKDRHHRDRTRGHQASRKGTKSLNGHVDRQKRNGAARDFRTPSEEALNAARYFKT